MSAPSEEGGNAFRIAELEIDFSFLAEKSTRYSFSPVNGHGFLTSSQHSAESFDINFLLDDVDAPILICASIYISANAKSLTRWQSKALNPQHC